MQVILIETNLHNSTGISGGGGGGGSSNRQLGKIDFSKLAVMSMQDLLRKK